VELVVGGGSTGGSSPGGSYPRWRLSWVAVVLGSRCPRWESSGGSCPVAVVRAVVGQMAVVLEPIKIDFA